MALFPMATLSYHIPEVSDSVSDTQYYYNISVILLWRRAASCDRDSYMLSIDSHGVPVNLSYNTPTVFPLMDYMYSLFFFQWLHCILFYFFNPRVYILII